MSVNVKSLQARLLKIAQEKKIDFQVLLNRLAGEQFLCRLSKSSYADHFIFKGGALLSYLINSDRKTKDFDFSIKKLTNNVEDVVTIIRSVLDTPIQDGFEWKEIGASPLIHPEMPLPGIRVKCNFLFGKMRGVARLDLAFGDKVSPVSMPIERIQYRGKPLFGDPFSLLVYPPETVYAEKLQIVLKKRGQNTRMKDYYDLLILIDHSLNRDKLRDSLTAVFANRSTPLTKQIQFEEAEMSRLQTYWGHFLKRDTMIDAPDRIYDVIEIINNHLQALHDKNY